MWTGLDWLRIGTGGELLWIRYWTFVFHKMLGNHRVSKQLGTSRVVLSSTELVKLKIVRSGNVPLSKHLHELPVSNNIRQFLLSWAVAPEGLSCILLLNYSQWNEMYWNGHSVYERTLSWNMLMTMHPSAGLYTYTLSQDNNNTWVVSSFVWVMV
jgi:hypothetical protein